MSAPAKRGTMSATMRLGALRAFRGPPRQLIAVELLLPHSTGLSRGTLVLASLHHQKRYQSSSSSNQGSSSRPPRPPPPSLSWDQAVGVLRESMSFKHMRNAIRGQSLRKLYRQSPEELVLALVILAACAGGIVYLVYAYFTYFQSPQFTRFPPDIAQSLRRALYYSDHAPDPKLALKYYRKALEQCSAAGLDPLSDEVMGIRIRLAAWLEKIQNFQISINILEAVLGDCKGWVALMEKYVSEGKIDNSGKLLEPEGAGAPNSASVQESNKGEAADAAPEEEKPEPENLWAKRRRLLAKSTGIAVKLGQLYSDEHVLQTDNAGERLVWAVETVLKELQRRQIEGVRPGEGDWMSPEEIGGALESLGNHYESKSQHYLAAPLYLQAISLSPALSCHKAVLMNNLAISLAQQPVVSPIEPAPTPADDANGAVTAPTRAALLASARSWALQARATADKVQGEERTEECDEACAVALCNLGDIAAMGGSTDEAKRWFQECIALSKKISFEPGVDQAQAGLKRLSTSKSKRDS